MDELEWRKQVRQDGFENISKIEWAPGLFNDMHTHDFKANLFVVSGEMTVKTDEEEITCGAGETGALDAGVPHSELVGSAGVCFLIARKAG